MSDTTAIEWTDATWNPIGGCTRVDEGCRNCYAEIMAARFSGPGQWGEGLARMVKGADGRTDHRWTGKMVLHEAALDRPLRWRRPRRIFVNSTSDLFHESVPGNWIDQVFAVMALCPQHTFQVLTKRPERAAKYLASLGPEGRLDIMSRAEGRLVRAAETATRNTPRVEFQFNRRWPLTNVWIGTSISDQASADARIPHLLACPAAVRFLSAEPLLGPVDLARVGNLDAVWSSFPDLVGRLAHHMRPYRISGVQIEALGSPHQAITYYQTPEHMGGFEVGSRHYPRLDWVIVGGESGPGARPVHPDWVRSLRNQCVRAGVPFFFKQWGEWAPLDFGGDVRPGQEIRPDIGMIRVGKKAAGRLLSGSTWDQMPREANG